MPAHILVVDDDISVRVLLKEILMIKGYSVRTVTNGAEAVLILQNKPHKYDLILTDIDMPLMDGIALGKYVHENHPQIPVIAITGNPEAFLPDVFFKPFFVDILKKPFDIVELLTAVEQNIG